MKKLSCLLMSAVLILSGCTGDLEERVKKLEDAVATLESNYANGFIITSVDDLSGGRGYKINFSNNTSVDVLHGGTPTITVDTDGWVWIDGEKTDTNLMGQTGSQGPKGEPGETGPKGEDAVAPKIEVRPGTDGEGLYIWYNVTKNYPTNGWVNTGVNIDLPDKNAAIQNVVVNELAGYATFTLRDGTTYDFALYTSQVQSIEIVATRTINFDGSESKDIVFVVNPSTAVVPVGEGDAIASWALSQDDTYMAETRASRVNPSDIFFIESIARDGEKTGQYVATVTSDPSTHNPEIEEYVMTLVLTLDETKELCISSRAFGMAITGPAKYRVDDLWPNKRNPEGIVFWIDPASSEDGGETGTAGWVMSLKQSPEYLMWCNKNVDESLYNYGTNSDIDGRLNWDAILAYESSNPDFAGSFDVFDWCRENFDEGWYLPSIQELRQFYAVYMGLTPEQTIAYMNGRKQYNVNNALGDPDVWGNTTEHRAAYDAALIAAGGDGISGGSTAPTLWSSTRYDVDLPAIEYRPWYSDLLGGWGSSSTDMQDNANTARAMRRFGAERVVDQLSVTPTVLTFRSNDTSTKTVTITKTSAVYDATTAPPAFTDEWIHITKSADSFTLTLDEYTASAAALNNNVDRVRWITVVAGYAQSVTVTVIQTAPINDMVPLDFTGTWNWTGEIWSDYPAKFTAMNGTVTAAFEEDLDCYVFKTLLENQAGTTLNGMPQTDGGVALRVDEDNNVTFVTEDEMNIWFSVGGLFGNPYRGYYNFGSFYSKENLSNVVTSLAYMQFGLPAGHMVDIAVSTDGNTITFPETGTYNDVECFYGLGFGWKEITSLTDHTLPPTAAALQAGGVYRNLTFTRAE